LADVIGALGLKSHLRLSTLATWFDWSCWGCVMINCCLEATNLISCYSGDHSQLSICLMLNGQSYDIKLYPSVWSVCILVGNMKCFTLLLLTKLMIDICQMLSFSAEYNTCLYSCFSGHSLCK